MKNYMTIIENGKFYYPASSHYTHNSHNSHISHNSHNSIVICDKCGKSNLIACIGYMSEDLCLACVDSLTISLNPSSRSSASSHSTAQYYSMCNTDSIHQAYDF